MLVLLLIVMSYVFKEGWGLIDHITKFLQQQLLMSLLIRVVKESTVINILYCAKWLAFYKLLINLFRLESYSYNTLNCSIEKKLVCFKYLVASVILLVYLFYLNVYLKNFNYFIYFGSSNPLSKTKYSKCTQRSMWAWLSAPSPPLPPPAPISLSTLPPSPPLPSPPPSSTEGASFPCEKVSCWDWPARVFS